ncbi:hypothetical protein ACHAXR_005436, partial [Thalassiosira sp. AJA248-18]
SGLANAVVASWDKRKANLDHDVAITAWALSVDADVRKDVATRMTGADRDAIERYITKLYAHDVEANVPKVIDDFWTEFKHWRSKTGMFSNIGRWQSPDALAGKSWLWHEKYSLPHTSVLGKVGCRSTSKLLGIGSAERSWGDVKHLKTNKRSHLSAEKTEMQAILYSTARVNEARIKRDAMEKIDARGAGAMWGDDDVNFDLGLETFGVNTVELSDPVRRRLFHAWVEDWEKELFKKNDCVAEARLLEKYKDLVFYDPDNGIYYTVWSKNL